MVLAILDMRFYVLYSQLNVLTLRKRKANSLENFIVFNLVIFAFDTSIQDKSEKALGLKDANFLSDSYILLVSLMPLTFLSNLQLPEFSVCHFSGTMWHPRSPLPFHVFGVRDNVCVLSSLLTVTLNGIPLLCCTTEEMSFMSL